MVAQKSTQTRVVGKITDKVHPYILFSSNMVSMKTEVRDAPCLLFSLYYSCLCTFLHRHPYLLLQFNCVFLILVAITFFYFLSYMILD